MGTYDVQVKHLLPFFQSLDTCVVGCIKYIAIFIRIFVFL